jgi:hypothetical protein
MLSRRTSGFGSFAIPISRRQTACSPHNSRSYHETERKTDVTICRSPKPGRPSYVVRVDAPHHQPVSVCARHLKLTRYLRAMAITASTADLAVTFAQLAAHYERLARAAMPHGDEHRLLPAADAPRCRSPSTRERPRSSDPGPINRAISSLPIETGGSSIPMPKTSAPPSRRRQASATASSGVSVCSR